MLFNRHHAKRLDVGWEVDTSVGRESNCELSPFRLKLFDADLYVGSAQVVTEILVYI